MFFNKKNIEYLKGFLGESIVETYIRVLEEKNLSSITEGELKAYNKVSTLLREMKRYKKNRWWQSGDKGEIACYQYNSNVLLVSYDTFIDAMEYLLDRDLTADELGELERRFKVE